MIRYIFLLLSFSFLAKVNAQRVNASYRYYIKKTSAPIKIDGLLDEPTWQTQQLANNFNMILPMDTSKATVKSSARLTYDEKFLYVSGTFELPHRVYSVESMRRDWNFGRNDNFILIMDTFNDQTNGFAFGLNAAGAQWDGLQFEGAPANLSWDNKWYSAVKQYEDHWTFEAAIPFKTIRYNKSLKEWGVNFARNDLHSTEKSAWAPVPRQFPSISSAFQGVLVWDEVPPAANSNISLIPYFLGNSTRNFEKDQPQKFAQEVGLDAKVSITPGLNLDLTVNPDFSQVEVDRQQTNFDRFELFFPERRQFFLENDDLFNNLGMERIRPFFSRRIGLGVPIKYGARLSGKLNKNLRIGAMNIGTAPDEDGAMAGQNYTVATLQQRVFARSNINAFIINREANGLPSYSRNIGIEYNLASKDNVWRGKYMIYKSFAPNVDSKNETVAGQLSYNTRRWNINMQYEKVGANYVADVGFFQRRGYSRINPRIGHTFFPKGGKILSHGPSVFSMAFFDKGTNTTDNTTGMFYQLELRTRAQATVFVANDYVKLLADFDPTNTTGIKLQKGSLHYWNSTGFTFTSQPQKLFTYGFESRYGGFFADGTRLRLAPSVGYRFQPYVALNVATEYNDINLPEEKGLKDAKFWLVSPRLDVTLTDKFYITTFYQYNQQINNTNINARIQWRYKPASDLFLVYTDNYNTLNSTIRNRSIVLKMTYWWNV